MLTFNFRLPKRKNTYVIEWHNKLLKLCHVLSAMHMHRHIRAVKWYMKLMKSYFWQRCSTTSSFILVSDNLQ